MGHWCCHVVCGVLLVSLGCTPRVQQPPPQTAGTAAPPAAVYDAELIRRMAEDAEYYVSMTEAMRNGGVEQARHVDFVRYRYARLGAEHQAKVTTPGTELETRFREAVNGEDYRAQVALADSVLQHDYADIMVHLFKAYALDKLGEDASLHEFVGRQLVESLLNTGDGLSYATAFRVARVAEEYALLTVLGMRSEMQSLRYEGDRQYDMLTCRGKDGRKMELYFDITEHMRGLRKMLE